MADYPLIDCASHSPQKSYLMCVHVANQGREAAWFLKATDKESGEILCKDCNSRIGNSGEAAKMLDDLLLVCELCARKKVRFPN